MKYHRLLGSCRWVWGRKVTGLSSIAYPRDREIEAREDKRFVHGHPGVLGRGRSSGWKSVLEDSSIQARVPRSHAASPFSLDCFSPPADVPFPPLKDKAAKASREA